MSRFLPLTMLCALVLGCAAQDLARLASARDQTVSALNQATQAQSALRQQLAALPPDDPARKALAPRLAKLNSLIAQGQQYLPVLDGAVSSIQTGQIDPSLSAAVTAVPYGSLALAAIALVWGLAKHLQAGKTVAEGQRIQAAFAQMVKALDTALPEPTGQQKAAIAGVLDTNTKARAAAVRAT